MRRGGARGRAYGSAVRTLQKLATKAHVALLKRTGGRIGARMLGSPVLVLVTTGRKSGARRETPLLSLEDSSGLAVVASNGGAPKSPAWYLNLRAKSEAEVLLGGETFRVAAREVHGEEKRRLWERLVAMYPPYAGYQKKTERSIPVLLLERV